MTLTLLVTLASMFSGQSCAAIDNGPNSAAFKEPNKPAVHRTYVDYGDNLGYNKFVPKRAWPASRAAEASLQYGKPAHKVVVFCA